FAGDCERDRRVSSPHQSGRDGSTLPDGIANRDRVLGSIRDGVRIVCAEYRLTDRRGEPGGVAVLRRVVGGVCARVRVQTGGRRRGVHGGDRGRAGDLRGGAVYVGDEFVVQRDREFSRYWVGGTFPEEEHT